MCGIIGYIGRDNAVPYLLKGLKRLEYRGYDSSGMAIIDQKGISVLKRKGKVSVLEQALSENFSANVGIGHTRWATHGEPSQVNAHPHLSENGMFAVVHNGIIENCDELKAHLKSDGYSFLSDTDTEVISQLLEKNYRGNIAECIINTVRALKGSFALAVLHRDFPDKIICAKKDSPLIVGKGDDCASVFSDITAADNSVREYYILNDGEFSIITRDSLKFFGADGRELTKEKHIPCDTPSPCSKEGFPHYMLKEIYEQPEVLERTAQTYIKNGKIVFDGFNISRQELRRTEKIYLVACGSAYHACLCGKYLLQEMTGIDTSAHIASEFRYDSLPLNERSLIIAVSQSGETADTLAALSLAKERGAHTIAVVNVKNSAMSQRAEAVIYTPAGAEISVATTKAYTCQLSVLYLLSAYLGRKVQFVGEEAYNGLIKELLSTPEKMKKAIEMSESLLPCAERLKDSEHIYFIGRGTDYALSAEGALKLKEISYIHCEAYPAGELKHGTISLIEKGTPVIAVCLREDIFKKTLSAVKEVKARGAFVIALTRKEKQSELHGADLIITADTAEKDSLTPLTGAIPLQLVSYYTALKRGCDIDKPRNLAKSVTVE